MEDVNREGWNNAGFDDVGCEKIECWTKFELEENVKSFVKRM